MGLFDSKPSVKANETEVSPTQVVSTPTTRADQNCRAAGEAVKTALLELGQNYFEANQDNDSSEFSDLIYKVKECIDKETLWKQYRLSLDGKLLCEHCGAVITSDSAFCNKCGGSIKPLDFSSILSKEVPVQSETLTYQESPKANVCPNCGSPLVEGAMYCEKCGKKL